MPLTLLVKFVQRAGYLVKASNIKPFTTKSHFQKIRQPFRKSIISVPDKNCPVGYFSSTGHIIPKHSLRTYQEIEDDKLCYCFDINAEHYLSALNANNAEKIKNFVIQKTKSGDCACDIKNPSGQCCLAKFKTLENQNP